MRRRLMLAMVGLVAVVLLIAGAGSLVLTRIEARNDAKEQLVSEADSLRSFRSGSESLKVLHAIRRTLRLENASVIRIDRAGNVTTHLPHGLTAEQLDVAALQAGETTSGRVGNVVYAAAPVDLSPLERQRLHDFEGTLAVLLTRDVGGLGPSWVYFTVAGAAALAVAALVASQMSRRMSRPLVEAVGATARIAAGDLESRVPVRDRDYPEFSSLAGSINHMAQSLEDGRARERNLLLAVSHDLRTPLTSIRGFAEAIKDGAAEDEERAADVIIAESRRLERLVGDLLDLTKLEARQMSISLRPTDVAEVVSTTAEGFRPAAARAGLALVVDVPESRPDQPQAEADPDRLAQLLANLMENALEFARAAVTVALGTDPETGACTITVDDDGPGIAPGDLERVFERFYRADRGPQRRAASGLGLAIVAELAAAMGGSVRAVSPLHPGGGSRFIVILRWWQGALPAPAVHDALV
jgi:signal transduction histidine kinase